MKVKKLVIGAAAATLFALGLEASATAHADGCGTVGMYGSCDFNYTADGSHEHCDRGWAPVVGPINNCFWVNAQP